MSLSTLLPFFAMAAIAAVMLRLMLRLGALRRLVARIEADRIEETPVQVPLHTFGAVLTSTFIRHRGRVVPISPPAHARPAQLTVTEWGLVVAADKLYFARIPHTRILDALIVRSGADSILRVDWERGGQKLSSNLVIDGGIRSAELVRREIHLRAKRIKLPTMGHQPHP